LALTVLSFIRAGGVSLRCQTALKLLFQTPGGFSAGATTVPSLW